MQEMRQDGSTPPKYKAQQENERKKRHRQKERRFAKRTKQKQEDSVGEQATQGTNAREEDGKHEHHVGAGER